MARVLYKGKKKNVLLPLPSGERFVNGGEVFEVTGDDLVQVKKLIDADSKNAIQHRAFLLADEYEMLSDGKSEDNKKIAANQNDENDTTEEKEASPDYRAFKRYQLEYLCKKRGIHIPIGSKKTDILKLIEDNEN